MRSFIMGCFLLFSLVSSIYAENGNITGKVIDSQNKQNIEYANIRVLNAQTKDFVFGSVTDQNGIFNIGNLKIGSYVVQISMIGYKTVEKAFSINSSNATVDFRTIPLSEDRQMLSEVVVIGQQPQMRFEIDKKVYNVGQNLSAIGGSASDILGNIPSVNVDAEGTISLRGNPSVTIWINGKASGLTSDNSAQIMEQLPSESIERVEIITNPSAKYNPEGTAGIINIILKQDRKTGYYGSVQTRVDTHGGYNLGGNLNYSNNKFDTYLNLSHRVRKGKGKGYTYRNNLDDAGNTVSFLNQQRRDKEKEWPYFARAGITYHLTGKDHLGFNFFGMLDNEKEDDMMDYTSDVPGSYQTSFRLSEDRNTMKIGHFELNYKRQFHEKSTLDLSVSRQYFEREATPAYNQRSEYADGSIVNSYQRQLNDNSSRSWEIQADYLNEFGEGNKVELGYKGDLARRESPVETYSGSTEQTATFDENLYNLFNYDQDVHALYATFSKRIHNFGIQLGARGEYTRMNTQSLAYGESEDEIDPYKKNYFSFYPSVFLSYALPNENELQLNYTRRVSRPNGRQLNSFMDIMDSTNISYGNPYLKPQYANAFELNYIKNWENHTLSLSAFYRTTDDVIQRISYLEDNIIKTTYENIAKTHATGTEFILKNRFFQSLDLTTTMSMYYNKLEGFTYLPQGVEQPIVEEDNDNFSWNGRIIANMTLPYKISFQATGNFNSKQITAQGYQKASGSLDLGIRKSFLDNALSFAVSARDVLNSRKRVSITSGNGFWQENSFQRIGRRIGFTLTYSFGNMGQKSKSVDEMNSDEL
ncbi:outer membrane beta-barrel family protein [Parabacteroides sp. Marseille-P3160]|uniref:outer membrane beta-barrel family protein n=1 Tax=Parabacteroides sp. Marseille-P3160 TaxID=1917887 RepID=UPI001F44D987|nr:outer membrane beta-barrel family protein [Parabacteroides sp. Marseille-P3160]